MKKLALFLVIVLCMGVFTAVPASAAKLSPNAESFTEGQETLFLNVNAYDILPNGSFEYTSDGAVSSWGVTCNQSIGGVQQNYIGSQILFRNASDAHDGEYSLQITNPSDTNASGATASTCIRIGVDVIPGVTYEMSAWVKVLDTTSGYARFHGMFTDAAGDNAAFSRMSQTYQNLNANPPITFPANTWVKKGLRFTAPEGAVRLTLYYYMEGKGSVLYDNITILAPKDSMSLTEGDAKKAPVLTENSPQFGNVYAFDLSKGAFENYDVGQFIHKGDNPGGHNAQVTDLYNHTENGSKSLWLKNKINPSHGDFQPNLYFTNVYLVPGATYQASTWILAPVPGTSSDFSYWINMTKSDGSTDQKKVHYGVKTYGWWREFIFEFTVPADERNVKTSIELRLMNDKMEYYIDDVSVYMVEKPPYADVQTDEMFYYTDFVTGKCTADPFSTYKNALVGGRVDYSLLDTDGVSVLDSKSVNYVDHKADYEFSLSLMEEKGAEYFVSAKVYDAGGVLQQEELLSVYRYDRPTYLGADGIFRKNGKEYNLIFGSGVTTELLEADPRLGGVTVVRLVADGTSLESRMDKAHEMGLLCLIGLYGNGKINSTEGIINTVNGVKNHPALFGYQVQDEPYQKGNPESELARAYKAIRDNDPDHVAYLVDSVEGGFDYLFRYADFVEIDYYGGAGPDSGRIIGQKIEAARASSKGRKPFGLTQQAFQYEGYLPTVDELRNFAYQNFFYGAPAMGYHSLGVDGSDGVTTPYMFLDDWAELCERWAAWEQGFLLDCFVNKKHTLINGGTTDDANWRLYRADGDLYAIVYNRNKDAAANVSIPLTDSQDNPLMTNFSATRITGTKGAEAKTVRGVDNLNLTLGGVIGREKYMTTVELGGLAAEIWKITPQNNIIPNGEFEESFNGAPTADWTTVLYNSVAGRLGNATTVSSAQVGEETITPAVVGSNRFLMIERTNGADGNPANLENRPGFIYLKLDSSVLKIGKSYRFEYYVNIPAAGMGEGVKARIGFQNGASGHVGVWRDHNWYAAGDQISYAMTSTNGWEKRTFDFVYDGAEAQLNIGLFGAGAEGVMFVDEMKLYEYTPATTLIHKENYEYVTTEQINTSQGGYRTRSSRGSLAIDVDPMDSTNKVLKVHPVNVSNPVTSLLKMNADDVTTPVSAFTEFDTLKISFRFYMPTGTYTSGETTKATNVDGFGMGITYKDVALTEPSTSGLVEPSMTFAGSDANKWIYVEAYVKGNCITQPRIYLRPGQTDVDFYIDDVRIEKLNTTAHISNMNIKNFKSYARITTALTDQNWGYIAAGDYTTTYKTTDTVRPIIALTAKEAGEKGRAVAVLVKVDNGAETVVALRNQEVGRVAISDLTGANAAETGIASEELSMNLAELNLSAGNYRIDYMLWSGAGISPLCDSVSFTVTD